MSKRKFNESEDKPHNDNDRDDFKKLKRSNTEPVGPIPKSNSDLEVTVPNLNKMPTMNPKKFAEISSDEESKKELGHDTSPDESEKSESEQMYFRY